VQWGAVTLPPTFRRTTVEPAISLMIPLLVTLPGAHPDMPILHVMAIRGWIDDHEDDGG